MAIAPSPAFSPPRFDFIAATPEAMEREPTALRQGIQRLGDRHLLTLKVPTAWGGQGLNRHEFFRFQQALTRHSGTLAFTQTQHQSAANFIANGENAALKVAYLPAMAQGQILVGVGYSQLRRSGPPSLRAMPSDRGYHLTGTIPWITGWGIFQTAVIAATLPNGCTVWGLLPLQPTPTVTFSAPLPLVGMPATQTVSVTFTDYELTHDRVLDQKPPDWISRKDETGVLNASAFSLGAAQAALDLVQAASQQFPELLSSYQNLARQFVAAQTAIEAALVDPETSLARQIELRGTAIALAGRCAQAAVTVSRGAANQLSHPAGRIYREVLLFTVSGQTPAVLAATLGQIAQAESSV
ncbi:MAG: acyl-CoA dehydrogenase family protein [Cyanobacteria bacterium P01_G01_bin.54]